MSKFIKKAVGFGVPFVEVPQLAKSFTSAPGNSDKNFPLGFNWIYKNGDNRTVYIFGGIDSSDNAVWSLASPGASDVDTINSLSPTAGNIIIDGGTNITDSNAGSTITLNLDAAITLATSVTSPLYTAGAGVDLDITSPAGQDVVIKLGDAAGANKLSVTDSADAEIFAVDSNGAITFTNFSNTGTFTTAGGTASLNASSNFNTVVNSGTSTGSVTVGNGAAGAVTVDTGAGISLDAATASNFTVSGATEDLTLASTAGTVILNSGEDAADAIYLHADGGTSDTIRLHADQGTGAASVHLESDAGGVTLTATGLASSDAINLNAVAGGIDMDAALDIVLTSTEDAADSIYFHADGGTSETIRLHSDQGTGVDSIHLESDAGGVTLTSTGLASADAINLSAVAGGVDIDGALQVNIASSQNAADAVRINASAGGIDIDAAGAAGEDITFDNAAGSIGLTAGEAAADALSLQAASGGLDIDTGLAIIADAAGNIELNSSAGTILIGDDDVDQNIELGTDGERTVTVGSVNGAAALVLQSGTGEITMTGTVKEIDAEFLEASGDEITSFSQSPLLTTSANTAGAATGATGDVNLMYLQQGVLMEQFILGAGQTIIGPRMTSDGLLVSLDLVATEGAVYNFGGARNNSRHAFTIGTSAAFFCEWQFTVATVSAADPYYCGFRKVEANNADYESYTDFAFIGLNQPVNSGTVIISSRLNSGAVSNTNTTDAWADTETHTLRVLVSAAGVVTYLIDGVAPSVTAAYTFDNGDIVVPEFYLLHRTGAAAVNWVSMKVGFQS